MTGHDGEGGGRSVVSAVLDFWFGEDSGLGDQGTAEPLRVLADPEVSERWFAGGAEFDRAIEERFGPLLGALEQALRSRRFAPGVRGLLAETPAAQLARVLVLDQFSRNLRRGTAGMFATDDLALAETLEGLDRGTEQRLGEDARAFFLMPLMHSEDREIQKLSVESFGRLVEECLPAFRERAENYLDFAGQHRAIVERFGRYPHRNEVLGRPSSPEEKEFLNEPGSSF